MINGSKMWITNAEHAGVFLVFANVAPEKVNNDKTHVTLLLPQCSQCQSFFVNNIHEKNFTCLVG